MSRRPDEIFVTPRWELATDCQPAESRQQGLSTAGAPSQRLVLKLPDGCPGFCQLELCEIQPVEDNPCRDKEARYRCRDCGREYRLLHEFGDWVHPAADGAILPGPPCLPGGTPLAGWPQEIPAPAWLEDLLRDFAAVIIRAGRQIAHAPENDCRFPVAIFWQPPDGPPHWSCPACGWRSVKVLDEGQVVDWLGTPLPEAVSEPDRLSQHALWPEPPPRPPIPDDELHLVDELSRWAEANGWPEVEIQPGIAIRGDRESWAKFVSYLSTRQVTEAADRSRRRKLITLCERYLPLPRVPPSGAGCVDGD